MSHIRVNYRDYILRQIGRMLKRKAIFVVSYKKDAPIVSLIENRKTLG